MYLTLLRRKINGRCVRVPTREVCEAMGIFLCLQPAMLPTNISALACQA